MGVYGQGNMPETKEASSKVTENSQRAGKEASPQRAVDGVNSVDGKGAFKGKEITPIEAHTDMSIKDKVMGAASSDSMSQQQTGTMSLGDSSKSFFLSNFSSIPGSVSSVFDESSSSTDSVSSTKFPESL
jgi:hypothetical protein